jgi:hypothetical protein
VESKVADKSREEFYLTKLRQALPEFANIQVMRSESPDFIFDQGGQRKGLEITVFHLPAEKGKKSHQETVSLRRHVVNTAERLHGAHGGPALYLHVIFNDRVRLRKAIVPALAKELAHLVFQSPVPSSIEDGAFHISPDKLPPEFGRVWFHASIDGRDRLWQAGVGGWVAPIGPEQISAVIREKNRLVSRYREACKEVWLVIVHDIFTGAAPSELSGTAITSYYQHKFDRVIWLEPHVPAVVELKNGTQLPLAADGSRLSR